MELYIYLPRYLPSPAKIFVGIVAMLVCVLAASPALWLAPPVMQLRQANSVSVFAAGRAVPMMAVEQHGQSAAFPWHCLPPGLLHALSRRASATQTPAAALSAAVSARQGRRFHCV